MDKYIYDKSNGLWYELQGDYYIPCLTLPEEENKPIGLWGQRHKTYLNEHRKAIYTTMLMEGKLNSYLADIDRQAQGITEQLKTENALEWVGRMNNIRACAMEIVNNEIIYA